MASSPPAPVRALRRRRLALLAMGGGMVLLLSAVVTLLASATASSFTARVLAAVAYAPTEADGMIDAAEPLTVENDTHPAMARLDADLRDALRAAQVVAATEGIVFDITSGWRSTDYQRWLLDDAIRVYGSEEVAREYVATPEDSSHVTGHAVDIGSLDAQLWLGEHGRAWGLCQTYANERWHFERATDAGGECPVAHVDARG